VKSDLFIKLKHQTSTMILLLSVRYSMRDLACGVNFMREPSSCDGVQ